MRNDRCFCKKIYPSKDCHDIVFVHRIIDIPNEIYNNFIRNEYSRADVIAIHAALVNSTSYETVTENAEQEQTNTKLMLMEANVNGYAEGLKESRETVTEFADRCRECGTKYGRLLNQKWIPISEISPKDGEWAIFTNGTQISIERYKMDALDHFFPSGRWFDLEDAIAWMPLPKPYGAQESEEE